MARTFFAQNWYRVAGLKPGLLKHVKAARHRYGRQVWYALHDPLSGRVHRVTPAAYVFAVRMDGRRTVDAIWRSRPTASLGSNVAVARGNQPSQNSTMRRSV